jgi:hypothetical protein
MEMSAARYSVACLVTNNTTPGGIVYRSAVLSEKIDNRKDLETLAAQVRMPTDRELQITDYILLDYIP